MILCSSDGGGQPNPYQQYNTYPGVTPQYSIPNMMPPPVPAVTGVVPSFNPLITTSGVGFS